MATEKIRKVIDTDNMSPEEFEELCKKIEDETESLFRSTAILYKLVKNKKFATKTMTCNDIFTLCRYIFTLLKECRVDK